MESNATDIISKLKDKLNALTIHELRQVGRAAGINSPSNKKKEVLIDEIISLADGSSSVKPRSTKGAHPKSDQYDREIVRDIEACRNYFTSISVHMNEEQAVSGETGAMPCAQEQDGQYEQIMQGVQNGQNEEDVPQPPVIYQSDEAEYRGILEPSDKYWFIRTQNCQITSSEDVFVHTSFINRFRLKTGDYVVCRAKRRREGECPGATYIISVNGLSPDRLYPRIIFENLTPCYPDKRYTLESEGCSLTERVIDLFSPIGNGQRALIVSPPKAGKTTMLKTIACSLVKNYPAAKVIVLLIDERPEEVTDIKRTVHGAEVIYSTFDKGEQHHIHAATLTMEYAKRLAETGHDVVILMDSLTRLTRAYNACNNSGRMLSGGLDPQALVEPRKFFGAARNVEDGGSLTIIATALIDTGSRLDNVIYEEFKSAGNMEIVLSRDLAERRVFPAIDIRASGARKEELLLSEKEIKAASKLRGMLGREINEESMYQMMQKTSKNEDFCDRLDDWIKIYRK